MPREALYLGLKACSLEILPNCVSVCVFSDEGAIEYYTSLWLVGGVAGPGKGGNPLLLLF